MRIELTEAQAGIIKWMLEKCEDWNYDYFDWETVEDLEKKFKDSDVNNAF